MFSCFCAQRKKQYKHKHPMSPQRDVTKENSFENTNNKKQISNISSTMETPQIGEKRILVFRPSQQSSIKDLTNEFMNNNKITSLEKVKDYSKMSVSDSQLQQEDSETVPYKSKMSDSGETMPKCGNMNQTFYNNLFKLQRSRKQIKTFLPHSKTPNEELIQRYFQIQKKYLKFHTKPMQKEQKDGKANSFVSNASIDYSRFSQIDRQVTSRQILDLDVEMENKLYELLSKSGKENRDNMTEVVSVGNNSCGMAVQKKGPQRRFQKMNKFNDIENDFDELQKAEEQIHRNVFINSNSLSKRISTVHPQRLETSQIQSELSQQSDFQDQTTPQSPRNQLVQLTVKSQLDCLIDLRLYFSDKQTLKSPQSFEGFRKSLMNEQDDTELMQQTLEEAENSFNCYTINEQFSRSVVSGKYELALKIFEIKR